MGACSGGHHGARTPSPPAAARDYSATRWIPAKPTYAIGARTVRDAQRTLRDLVESFGMIVQADAGDLAAVLSAVLAVDPLSPEAVAGIGVDLEGGFAMFSEGVNPTFVVHLASPDQMRGFLDQQRANPGFKVQSQIVDGTELYSANVSRKVKLSWAIVGDWMWLHVALDKEDGVGWFTASVHPGAPTWGADWQWAAGSGAAGARQPPVLGIVDVRALLGVVTAHAPVGAAACARMLAPASRVAIAIEGDGKHAGGRLAIDIGPAAAAALAHVTLPPPDGWAQVAPRAALAVQWNVDVFAARSWAGECLGNPIARLLAPLDGYGVRAARALVLAFDPDAMTGQGAASLELANKKYFASLLDKIPLRSTMEKKRTFGPYAGKTLSVPFGPTVDYVLTDSVALAGMGDGVLASVVGKGPAASGPLVAIDVAPPVLAKEVWIRALDILNAPQATWLAEHLVRWRDGHVALSLDGTRLVLEASGNRR